MFILYGFVCTRFTKLCVIFFAGLCVIGSVLVLCGHDVWFLVLYLFVYLRVWCVIPLEQVLVCDTLTLKHGQFQTGVGTYLQVVDLI
jgi:hypothetical protein